MALEFYEPKMKRESAICSWQTFCEKLYEVLYKEAEGFVGTEKIVHNLFQLSGIDANVVAQQRGHSSFEEMLRSPNLAHVVTIEQNRPKPDKPYWIEYRYRAALNHDHFVAIRKRTKVRKPGFFPFVPSGGFEGESSSNAGTSKQHQAKKTKEVRGELFSYEVDTEDGEEGEEECQIGQKKGAKGGK